jgi:Protein of unknown function (DUF3179)
VYARRVKGEVLEFGHRGWLYEESFLFYDDKTDSLWVQATGEAVYGPYKGTRLDRLPATQTTWKEWRHLHPDTLVLGRRSAERFAYHHDSYDRYYDTGRGIKYQRNAPLHFGLAVFPSGPAKLYPFTELEKHPVLLDSIDGERILVVFHARTRTAVAFDPRVNGKSVPFTLQEAGETDVVLAGPDGSSWSGLTGRCIKGLGQGSQLRQLLTTQFVVENWPLHYPKGQVYRSPESPSK